MSNGPQRPPIDDLWYKNAIIYCLDVEKYVDSNGDGIGDFGGLTRRLDYLAGLGITCVWLQPFYPSPNRDNGYDVADYYGVHPKHGTLGEFVEFMNHAQQIGLRVIVDLDQPHVRPPSVVSSGAQGSKVGLPQLVRVVEDAPGRVEQGNGISGGAESDLEP
jgi:1,4-alpha-glucan branching enzyme